MTHQKSKGTLLIGIGILAASLVVLSGCAKSQAIVAQPFLQTSRPQPIELTVDQLYSEYMADEAAADAKYKGKRLQFTNVVVETIHGHFSTGEAWINDLRDNPEGVMDYFLVAGSVRFEAQYPHTIREVLEGTVIDIEGDVQGISKDGLIIVSNCWLNIITGGAVPGY